MFSDKPQENSILVKIKKNEDFGNYKLLTCEFDDYEIKPETGKLLVFSNSVYKHSVSKIDGGERFALSIWYNQ